MRDNDNAEPSLLHVDRDRHREEQPAVQTAMRKTRQILGSARGEEGVCKVELKMKWQWRTKRRKRHSGKDVPWA